MDEIEMNMLQNLSRIQTKEESRNEYDISHSART
jgi:hypothetical protein